MPSVQVNLKGLRAEEETQINLKWGVYTFILKDEHNYQLGQVAK